MNDKFSIVTPTLWKYPPYIRFLEDLVDHELVDEIIIINNNWDDIPKNSAALNHNKVKIYNFTSNIGVNPAWNLGVSVAANKKICILNDDLIFDLKLLKRINQMPLEKTGVIGLCNDPPTSYGCIEINPWVGQNTLGFGCLMFVHKDWWVDIPDSLKIYYGDNWIFDTCLIRGKTNYVITDLLFKTEWATSTRYVASNVLHEEDQIYKISIDEFAKNLVK